MAGRFGGYWFCESIISFCSIQPARPPAPCNGYGIPALDVNNPERVQAVMMAAIRK